MSKTTRTARSSTRNRYRAVLRHPSYRRLFYSQLASELGDFAGRIALVVLVVAETESTLGAGAVLAVAAIPYLGLGQYLTGWSARFAPVRVLIVADIVRATIFAAIALDIPIVARFVLLFLASTASPVFESVRNGLTPHTVPTAELTDAIGLQTVANEIARIGGLALGGWVATSFSPEGTLLANATTFLASAVLLAGIRVGSVVPEATRVRVSEGWRALVDDPVSRRTLILFASLVAFGSLPEALVVPFVGDELPNDPTLVGVFAALVSVAIIATIPLLNPPEAHIDRVRQAASVSVLGAALAAAVFLLPTSIPSTSAAYFLVGIPFAGRIITGAAISERLTDRVRASAFSVYDGVISVGQLVAGLGGGFLAEVIGVKASFIVGLTAAASVALVVRFLPVRDVASADCADVEPEARTTQ